MRSITVRIRSVFRPDDPDAITVLRLAAVANDLDTLARMLLDLKEDQAADGKRRYALRMTALHLSDIKELVNHSDFDRVVARCSSRQGFESVSAAATSFRERLNTGPLRDIMGRLRNGFGGHYDRTLIAQALEQVEEWELMDLPGQGCRHNVVDRLFDISLAELAHARFRRESIEKSLRSALDDILDLHGTLIPVVQGLVTALYAEGEGL